MASTLLFSICVGTLLFAISNAQIHLTEVACYECSHDNHHQFPGCLKSPKRCASGEVCRIYYGHDLVSNFGNDRAFSIGCARQGICHEQHNPDATKCPTGGNSILHDHYCEQCCTTDDCVYDTTNAMRLAVTTSKNLFCPGTCNVNSLEDCIDNGRICERGRFCRVRIDHASLVHGDCQADRSFRRCQFEKDHLPCPENITSKDDYYNGHFTTVHRCTHDCCTDNKCLLSHFGIPIAQASLPAIFAPPNAPNDTTDLDLWQLIHGTCQDQLDHVTCQNLKTNNDLCHNRLALSMCPQTCGMCDVVNSTVCRDTSGPEQCGANTEVNVDYCNTDQAVFACPKSCNKCEKLIYSIIISLLEGNSTATQVPATQLPSTVTGQPSVTFPTVNCHDLDTADCTHLIPLCQTSFLSVVCPQQCHRCTTEQELETKQ